METADIALSAPMDIGFDYTRSLGPVLGRFMTGLLPTEISGHLKVFESGRALDDYGTALVRFENGALGTVTASQISHGRENDLFIEVDGTKGALEWQL